MNATAETKYGGQTRLELELEVGPNISRLGRLHIHTCSVCAMSRQSNVSAPSSGPKDI